jgi:hypothetical protein
VPPTCSVLAREAQIAYATLAMVTDYDCWHPRESAVTADVAIANLMKNAGHAQQPPPPSASSGPNRRSQSRIRRSPASWSRGRRTWRRKCARGLRQFCPPLGSRHPEGCNKKEVRPVHSNETLL